MTYSDTKQDLTPVLMLVPYFAPQTHAAMFRAHKLAKYLPQHGYRPVVVTVDINYLYNENADLLNELPPETQVHRARYIEPTLRGLRMALGGSDRTFAALKQKEMAFPSNLNPTFNPPKAQSAHTWTSDLVRWFGEWPDRHWTWSISARWLCRRLIKEQNIRLLYTTAVPVSPLKTALDLQREFDLKWVADFRDPIGYGRKHSATGMVSSMIERRILCETMRLADKVTGLANSYGQIFFDLFELSEERYRFIPTGLDEAYLGITEALTDDTGMLLHVGEVMPNQSPYAFEVLASARVLAKEATKNLHLVFVGRQEINEPRIREMTGKIAGWDIPITFVDHAPQSQVYELARRARACLLIPGQHRYWWTNFAKLVDYLALRVPVIADVPTISEARQELGKASQGLFLIGDLKTDVTALIQWLEKPVSEAINDYGQRYTAWSQAKAFAEVFDEILMDEEQK